MNIEKELQETVASLDAAFNRGDVEALMAFYAEDATMVVQPGLVVSGHGAIREVFTQLSHHGMCAVQNRVATLASGDTALFLSRWELRRPDGTVSHHTATSVLRRGLDRRWRIQIDNAFGPEVLGPVLAQCRIIPPEAGELARVLGTEVLIKLRSGESGGVISLVTTREDEGSGPPPHLHAREDEVLVVLEGEYEFSAGGATYRGGPGTMAVLRRGEPHGYRQVAAGGGKLLAIIIPGGFEGFFAAIDKITTGGPPSIDKVLALADQYGVKFTI